MLASDPQGLDACTGILKFISFPEKNSNDSIRRAARKRDQGLLVSEKSQHYPAFRVISPERMGAWIQALAFIPLPKHSLAIYFFNEC